MRERRPSSNPLSRHACIAGEAIERVLAPNSSCSVVRAAIMSTKSKNTHEGRLIEIKTRLYPVLYENWGLRRSHGSGQTAIV